MKVVRLGKQKRLNAFNVCCTFSAEQSTRELINNKMNTSE